MSEILDLAVDRIVSSPWQPRTRPFDPENNDQDRELVTSICRHGILTRLLVWKRNGHHGQYELIAGHRRLAAARCLGHSHVPAEDVTENHGEANIHAMVLAENLARSDLTPIEEARAYQDLMALRGLTQQELAELVGCSPGRISQRLGMLKLAEPVQELVQQGNILPSIARTLITVDDAQTQVALATHITERIDTGEMTARKAASLTKQVVEWSDPAAWLVPDGVEVDQRRRNYARALSMLIEEQRQAGTVGELLLALCERGVPESAECRESWQAAHIFSQAGTAQYDFYTTHGMSCETCTRRERGLLIREHAMPCNDEQVATCEYWTAAEDPVRIILSWTMIQRNTCEGCPKLVQSAGYRGELLCSDAECYAHKYQEALEADGNGTDVAQLARQQRAVATAEAWRDSQAAMDADHWLAMSCEKCMYLAHGQHCEFARNWDTYGEPFKLMLAQHERRTVPLCNRWQLKSLRLIEESGVTLERALLWLAGLFARTSGWGISDLGEHLGMRSGSQDTDKWDSWLAGQVETLGQAATLLTMSVNSLDFPGWYSHKLGADDAATWSVRNPFTGEEEVWTLELAPEMKDRDSE